LKKIDQRIKKRTDEQNKFIGERIKYMRTKERFTQKELGVKVDRSEIAIRKYEKGIIEAPFSVLNKIAGAFGVSTYELLTGNSRLDDLKEAEKLIDELDVPYYDIFDFLTVDGMIVDGTQGQGYFYISELISKRNPRLEVRRDANGATLTGVISREKLNKRACLIKLLLSYDLVKPNYAAYKLDKIESLLIPYLKFLIDDVDTKDSDN